MNEGFQPIELKELILIIIRKWWIIAVCILAIVTVGMIYTLNFVTPIFEATATIIVGRDPVGYGEVDSQQLYMDSQLFGDYTDLVYTRLIADEVMERLDLSMMVESLQSGINLTSSSESRFVYLHYYSYDSKFATDVVNMFADVMVDKAMIIGGVDNIRIVDYALVPNNPISPNISKNFIVFFGVGFILGIVIIFLANLFDNRIKSEIDIEKKLGLSVIGVIPKDDFKEGK